MRSGWTPGPGRFFRQSARLICRGFLQASLKGKHCVARPNGGTIQQSARSAQMNFIGEASMPTNLVRRK